MEIIKTFNAALYAVEKEAVMIGGVYRFIEDIAKFYNSIKQQLEAQDIPAQEILNDSTNSMIRRIEFALFFPTGVDYARICKGTTEFKEVDRPLNNHYLELFFAEDQENVCNFTIPESDEEIGRLMFELSLQVELSQNKIRFNLDKVSLDKFKVFLTSADPKLRKFGYLIALGNYLMEQFKTTPELSFNMYFKLNDVFKMFVEVENKGNEIIHDSVVLREIPLRFRQVIPHLVTIITANMNHTQKIPSYDQCREVLDSIPLSWEEESIAFYERVLKIRDLFIKIKDLDLSLRNKEIKKIEKGLMIETIRSIETFYSAKNLSSPYPSYILDEPARSVEDFVSNLKASQMLHLENNRAKERADSADASKSNTKKTAAKKKNKVQTEKKLAKGSSSNLTEKVRSENQACPSSEIPTEDDHLDPLSILWSETREKIEHFTLDPRVNAWFISKEDGLASRSNIASKIDDEELILTHRLPVEILNLIFHDDYSRKTTWRGNPHHTTRVCLAKINNVMHKVEVTADEENCIYHFFARPAKKTSDYLSLAFSTTEFPCLSKQEITPDFCTHNYATLKGSKNIEILFDDNHYEVFYLG